MENVGIAASQGNIDISGTNSATAAPTVRHSGDLATPDSVRAALGGRGFEAATPGHQATILRDLIADARDPSKPPVSADVARELLAQATYAFAGVPAATTRESAAGLTNAGNLLMGAERMTTALAEREGARPPSSQVPETPFRPGTGMQPPQHKGAIKR